MKKIILMLALATATLTASATDKKKQSTQQTVTFSVSMHCANCQKKIEGTVGWEKGVKDLKTNLQDKTVTIKYDTRKTSPDQLKQSIEKLGYKAEPVKATKESAPSSPAKKKN